MMGKTRQFLVLTVLLIITASCGKDDSASPTATLTGKTWYADSIVEVNGTSKTTYVVTPPEFLTAVFSEVQVTISTPYDSPEVQNYEFDGSKLWIWDLGSVKNTNKWATVTKLDNNNFHWNETMITGTQLYYYFKAK